MRSLSRSGLTGLVLLACMNGGPAAAADQAIDEPAPFGVMQFAAEEAWIDLPTPLLDTWNAALGVLAEMKYAVTVDAAYVDSNGRIEVGDLWLAIEPHGRREKPFTRVRISLVAEDKEYAQVRAEVILDAVATRLAPAPEPAFAPAAVEVTGPSPVAPPVDPAYQDPYSADLIYGLGVQQAGATNIYNTYVSYPTPYYADYSYYPPAGNYFPYWSCWNPGGWNSGAYWSGNYSWYGGISYGYWNAPGWGAWGWSPWGCGGYYSGWYGWGSGVVVVIGDDDDDCDDDDWDDDWNDNDNQDYGDDVQTGNGKNPLALDARATDLTAVATAKPMTSTEASGAGVGGLVSAEDTPVGGPRIPPRNDSLPRIRVTERPRQTAAPTFDPRTVVTRTVATRSSNPPTVTRTGTLQPRNPGSTSTSARSTPRAGTVVRMSSPSFTPGFAGVIPTAYRTSGGSTVTYGTGGSGPVSVRTSAPYGVSSGSGSGGTSYGGSSGASAPSAGPVSAPVPVAHMPVSSPAPAQRFTPAAAPRPAPSSAPSPSFGSRPPPVTAPSPVMHQAPSAPRSSGPSAGPSSSFGGGSRGGSSPSGSGAGGGGSSGGSASSGGKGGRGKP